MNVKLHISDVDKIAKKSVETLAVLNRIKEIKTQLSSLEDKVNGVPTALEGVETSLDNLVLLMTELTDQVSKGSIAKKYKFNVIRDNELLIKSIEVDEIEDKGKDK